MSVASVMAFGYLIRVVNRCGRDLTVSFIPFCFPLQDGTCISYMICLMPSYCESMHCSVCVLRNASEAAAVPGGVAAASSAGGLGPGLVRRRDCVSGIGYGVWISYSGHE